MKRIKKGLAFFLATWIWMLALPVGTLSAMENTAEFLDGGESVSHFKQNAFEQCAEPSGRTFFDGRGY